MTRTAYVLLTLALAGCGRTGFGSSQGRANGANGQAGDAGVTTRACMLRGFAAAVSYPMDVEGLRLLPADVTGDGRLDLLVGGWWQGQNTFKLFANAGDGSFSASSLALAPAMTFANLVTADFNRDGLADLASQSNGADGMDMQLGDGVLSTDLGAGRAGFAPQSTGLSTPQTTSLLAAGDFDGDGLADLAFAGNDYVEVYGGLPVPAATNFAMNLYRNPGDGRFREPTSLASASNYTSLVTGDFDGDGHLDLATDAFGVFFNRGDGTFADEVTFTVPSAWGTCGLAAADFDDDGVTDLVTTTAAHSDAGPLVYALHVLPGSRNHSFGPPADYAIPSPPSMCAIAIGDFNGDGRPDIAMAMARDGQSNPITPIPVLVFENRGDGTFAAPASYVAGGVNGDNPTGLGVGDFNADGVTDLVLSTQNGLAPYADVLHVVLSRCD